MRRPDFAENVQVDVRLLPRKKEFPTRPVIVKEVKLPVSSQTHELAYDSKTQAVDVSQMPESILTQVKLQRVDGNEDVNDPRVQVLLSVPQSMLWICLTLRDNSSLC